MAWARGGGFRFGVAPFYRYSRYYPYETPGYWYSCPSYWACYPSVGTCPESWAPVVPVPEAQRAPTTDVSVAIEPGEMVPDPERSESSTRRASPFYWL